MSCASCLCAHVCVSKMCVIALRWSACECACLRARARVCVCVCVYLRVCVICVLACEHMIVITFASFLISFASSLPFTTEPAIDDRNRFVYFVGGMILMGVLVILVPAVLFVRVFCTSKSTPQAHDELLQGNQYKYHRFPCNKRG